MRKKCVMSLRERIKNLLFNHEMRLRTRIRLLLNKDYEIRYYKPFIVLSAETVEEIKRAQPVDMSALDEAVRETERKLIELQEKEGIPI